MEFLSNSTIGFALIVFPLLFPCVWANLWRITICTVQFNLRLDHFLIVSHIFHHLPFHCESFRLSRNSLESYHAFSHLRYCSKLFSYFWIDGVTQFSTSTSDTTQWYTINFSWSSLLRLLFVVLFSMYVFLTAVSNNAVHGCVAFPNQVRPPRHAGSSCAAEYYFQKASPCLFISFISSLLELNIVQQLFTFSHITIWIW